jgi:type 1 fimbriae regulatory protein FimB/type 1 fimbriae regulatory protein FimE
MLRHAQGFKLANDGVDTRAVQDYLAHKSIANTARCSRLSPERVKIKSSVGRIEPKAIQEK